MATVCVLQQQQQNFDKTTPYNVYGYCLCFTTTSTKPLIKLLHTMFMATVRVLQQQQQNL